MRISACACTLICLFFTAAGAQEASAVLAPGAELEKAAGGYDFTEGPASDAEGNVFFTDQPNNRILRWGLDGEVTTYMQPAGRSNGLCFDDAGNLWACADEDHELWRISPEKDVTVVLSTYEGEKVNGPNDLWIAPDGAVYFTDPYYKRPWWDEEKAPQPMQAVYRLAPDHETLSRVADDLDQPNGVIGTPDGKTLYVADIGAKKTYRYNIGEEGALENKTLFCEMGSDGMTIDDQGNVYLTGDGVFVFDKNGEQIEHIEVPERWTANVCFGGKDMQTLFITASKGLYTIKTQVKGVGSQ